MYAANCGYRDYASSLLGGAHLPHPKGEGVSDDIRQWRPITILNTVYKIFAKVLSLQL